VRIAAALAALALAGALPAAAQDRLAPLIGKWVAAQASSEASANMAGVKSLSFELQRDGDGFYIDWTQQRAEPDTATGRTNFAIITRSLQFRRQPGAEAVWVADGRRDGTLESLGFARFKGDTLVISTVMMTPEGDAELQLYERQAVGDKLNYVYRRFIAAEQTTALAVTMTRPAK
jgi:hypothetical protein